MTDKLFSPEFLLQVMLGIFSLIATAWGVVKFLIAKIEASEQRMRAVMQAEREGVENRINKRVDEVRDHTKTVDSEIEKIAAKVVDNFTKVVSDYALKKEVEVIGQRVDQAMDRLEKKIDRLGDILLERRPPQ